MDSDGGADGPRKRRRVDPPGSEPYVLHELVKDVPLVAEHGAKAYITCVESWNDNLYVGTSAGEVLHFVSLPDDTAVTASELSFIFASRLPIGATGNSNPTSVTPGVQQILVLPSASKACILCNGVVTFYSLPELSPVYGTTKVGNCNWIGGLNLNESIDNDNRRDPVIMIAAQNRIMLVRICEDRPRSVRYIEYPGCLLAARRDTIACVADDFSYSLIEVEQRQKIQLFPISSSEEHFESGHMEDMRPRHDTPGSERHPGSNGHSAAPDGRGHGRSASLHAIAGGVGRPSQSPRSGSRTPEPSANGKQPPSPEHKSSNTPKPLPEPSGQTANSQSQVQKPLPAPPKHVSRLKPHIVSPTPSEFLLVTGTDDSDPGVGMFVNLDGEISVRGTLRFQSYPEAIVLDSGNQEDQPRTSSDHEEGYILAVMSAQDDQKFIEVQRWDIDPGEGEREKSAIPVPTNGSPVGIHWTVSPSQMNFREVSQIMQMVRLKSSVLGSPPSTPPESNDPRTKASIEQFQKERELFETQETDSEASRHGSSLKSRPDWETERNLEEQKFASNLGQVKSNIILWSGDKIWRVLRNPWALQLESMLRAAQSKPLGSGQHSVDRDTLSYLVHGFEHVVPKTETEFLGLQYVKQKASLLLFMDLVSSDVALQTPEAIKATEDALEAGNLDPRLILLMVPLLSDEVVQSPQGIWVYGGLAEIAEPFLEMDRDTFHFSSGILHLLVRYLLSWQKKRGYGSVTDDTYVFDSVDSALLRLLLELDAQTDPRQKGVSTRSELNKLVDNWKGNFDRAVQLLESYQRLYVLSRLYQSRKMSRNVLETWRRIIEGETDTGGELPGPLAEAQVQKYLIKIRDTQLVEDYGSWLAARNPQLGIQVFADDSSRVRFDISQVISLLKERAPDAVQYYLEYLVFTKNYSQYADDLIGYYLDTVLSVLESSREARSLLSESYSTYRALHPPKPSYLNFITENAPPERWWQSRLRLLQLLGGGGPKSLYTSAPAPKDLSYSISTVLARIEPFQNELVSESIILGGRQGRHREALHLLTHGLGDYDTAIRYCIFGGPSSTTSAVPSAPPTIETQKTLFRHLLHEFLQISDLSDRIERTSDLLARFAPLFDVSDVLAMTPDDWTVDALSGYLVRVLRDLVSESREAKVQRALSAGLNLRVGAEYLNKAERISGYIESDEGVTELKQRSNSGQNFSPT
ncbi:hypothetical protein VTO42DRAFT_9060 [Malbranchea cinnamomea]